MSWWDVKARATQAYVIEREFESTTEVNNDIAQRAMVHSRQDMVLLVVYLSALNRQLSWITWLLILGVILLGVISAKLYGYR